MFESIKEKSKGLFGFRQRKPSGSKKNEIMFLQTKKLQSRSSIGSSKYRISGLINLGPKPSVEHPEEKMIDSLSTMNS